MNDDYQKAKQIRMKTKLQKRYSKFFSGVCCATAASDDHGFICYFVVNKNHRGKGIGGKLLSRTMERLGSRNIFVYSTADAINVYEKGGFKNGNPPTKIYGSRFVPDITGNVSE